MWERFSYYGMRGLLVLYLTTAVVSGGLGFNKAVALPFMDFYSSLLFHANDWWILNRPFSYETTSHYYWWYYYGNR